MSVLIRGMDEIPEDGTVLIVKHDDNGKVYIKYAGMMGCSMELVKLPEHHGNLIDADYLMEKFSDRIEKVSERYGVYSSEAGILAGAMKLLQIQFVIIEAEGGE